MHSLIVPHGAPVDVADIDKLEVMRHSGPILWKQVEEVIMKDGVIPARQ